MKGIFANEGVSLARLLSLKSVVEAGSIANAAGGDSNLQSQLSRQIKELEKVLHLQLLDRIKKPHSPTLHARALADSCQRFVCEIEDIVISAAGLQKPIAVGAGEIVIREFLIPMIGPARGGDKLVKWCMRNLRRPKIQEGLASEWLDIGIASGLVPEGQVCVEELSGYGFKLILPDGVKPDKSGWEKMSRVPLAMLEGDSRYKAFVTDCAQEAGVDLMIGAECTSFAQAVSLAQVAGWAVFVPEYWWLREKAWKKRTQYLPGLESFQRTLQLGWNRKVRERRPEIGRLIEALLKNG